MCGMKKMFYFIVFLNLLLLQSVESEAKRYDFSIYSQREVYVTRSTKEGDKMLKVIAYGNSVDKAIEQAMVDAVVSLIFDGVAGEGEMEGCPAVLLNGHIDYQQNKNYFDVFFKKGLFLKYVEKVNSTFPTGVDNVKTPKGRRIQILLIVHWKKLAEHFKDKGFKTIVGELQNY